MKKVTHRVDENHFRRFPLQWLVQPLWPKRQVESCFVWMASHAAEALSNPLRVTMIATGTDLGAAGRGVPRRVGPLDLCVLSHDWTIEHNGNSVNARGRQKVASALKLSSRHLLSSHFAGFF